VHIGLDYFDASINRIAAWVIGARNVLRAALIALLEPTAQLRQLEISGNYTGRLALLEEVRGLPWQAVWDYFCLQNNTPVGIGFMDEVRAYERSELSKRQ
jgi:L-rhamnose isomerase